MRIHILPMANSLLRLSMHKEIKGVIDILILANIKCVLFFYRHASWQNTKKKKKKKRKKNFMSESNYLCPDNYVLYQVYCSQVMGMLLDMKCPSTIFCTFLFQSSPLKPACFRNCFYFDNSNYIYATIQQQWLSASAFFTMAISEGERERFYKKGKKKSEQSICERWTLSTSKTNVNFHQAQLNSIIPFMFWRRKNALN